MPANAHDRTAGNPHGQRVVRERLLALQDVAASFYRAQLDRPEGARPAEFLDRIGAPVDGPWALGFAPDRPTAVVNELRRRGFSDVEIRASGLVRTGHRGQLVDRFRNRIMVGIRDEAAAGKPVVGFVGYAPPNAGPDVPACIYSAGTTIFRPRTMLFGLAEQEQRVDRRAIVAAHPLDAIAVSTRTAGDPAAPLVVAPAAQKLTHRHVEALQRVADLSTGVGVTLRTDAEGRRAAEGAYRLLGPVVGAKHVMVASWATGEANTHTLAEALAIGRVETAADPATGDGAREASTRSAAELLEGQDSDVSSRVRGYAKRRLGRGTAGKVADELALDFTTPAAVPPRAPEQPATPAAPPKPPTTSPPQAAPPAPAPTQAPAEPAPEQAAPAPASPERAAPQEKAAPPEQAAPEQAAPPEEAAPSEEVAQEEEAAEEEAAEPEPSRFRPSGQGDLAPSSERARVRANLDALAALKTQLDEDRPATPDEQRLYARWSGWGATPALFDEHPTVKERYASERAELRALLDDDEYRAARRTTLNAHYTHADYVQSIWRALTQLGFKGGRVLEPGCGSGNFIGFAPEGAEAVGVELDPTTASIAQALYPDAQIRAESFADTIVPDGSFDVVIGNVPFGKYSLRDQEHNPGRRHSIHNHFFLKSLRLMRPGGMLALITSRYTMDGQGGKHQAARAEMAAMADLIGAVRLPAKAHFEAAGTEVVTDLILLRRRDDTDVPQHAGAWRDVRNQEFPSARDTLPAASFEINEYFLDHPELVLGEAVTESGPHGPRLSVRGDGATAPALGAALDRIVAAARQRSLVITEPERNRPALAFGGSSDPEGRIKDLGNGRFVVVRNGLELPHLPPKSQAAELSALIGLRDTVLALLDEEQHSRDETWRMNDLRVELNRRYDAYVKKFKPINRFKENKDTQRRTYPGMGGFRKDPHWSSVKMLEVFDDEAQEAKKYDIFRGRVVKHPTPVDRAASPDDALVVTWDMHNEVRLDEVARLLGLETDAQARTALGTLVYDDPETGKLIRRAEYLSGNVRHKLAAAERAAPEDQRFAVNVEALRKVVPRDLTVGEIAARLGSPWIDASYVQSFLRELLEDDRVTVSNVGTSWSVKGGDARSVLARTVWGTERRSAQDLAERLLNSQPIEVFDKLKDGGQVKNGEATTFAQAKAEEIDTRFRSWLWEDPVRAKTLSRLYNDRFNALVPQSFDGEHITAPGYCGPPLRPHQMAAVARIRNTPGVGLFHGTGAGKTLEMIVGCMELVRLGLATKPAFVVPKRVVDSFHREFMQAYPLAQVLAVDSEDLTGDKRRDFVARCGNGNPDAVIISHDAFKKIPVSKQIEAAYLERQKQRLEAHADSADDADRHLVKDIEEQVANLEGKIEETLARSGDPGLEFERTGIGYLFIDEAHNYKNLMVISSIRELAHPGNQKTADLDMKLGYLRERYGNRVVTLATATPVDNSPSEFLTMMKYAAPELLEALGIFDDDAFHGLFIQSRRRLEMTPDGSRFESRLRYARYVNLPELKRLLYSWADVKLKRHLKLGEPSIVGGKPEILTVPASPELIAFLAELAERARAVTGTRNPPLRATVKGEMKPDNILWISTDGRLASLDLRLVGLSTRHPQKIDVLADRIAQIWREHRDDAYYLPDGTPEPQRGGLQLVFCDLGVPSSDRWSVYEALRDELVERGLPADQIRFAQDAKTRTQQKKLQQDAVDGKTAVLLGSRAGLGTGVNVQRRVVGMWQVDPTWKYTPIEQSRGRGQRQGNMNSEVHDGFAVTQGSYDPFLWQKVHDKMTFTAQMLDPDETARTIDLDADNEGRINPAVMFAIGAGKPELMELYTLEEAVKALKIAQTIWHNQQATFKSTISQCTRKLEQTRDALRQLEALIDRRRDTRGDAFAMIVAGQRFDQRAKAGARMLALLASAAGDSIVFARREVARGELGGFDVTLRLEPLPNSRGAAVVEIEGVPEASVLLNVSGLEERDPTGLVRTLENRLLDLDDMRKGALEAIEQVEANAAQAQARVGQPFPQEQELAELSARYEELEKQLESIKESATAEADAAPAESPSEGVRPAASDPAALAPGLRDPEGVGRELRVQLERHRGPLSELEADALSDRNLLEIAHATPLREFARDFMQPWVSERMSEKRQATENWAPQFVADYYPSDHSEGVRGDVKDYLIARIWSHVHIETTMDPTKQAALDAARDVVARLRQLEADGYTVTASHRSAVATRRDELAAVIRAEFETEVGPPGPALRHDPSRKLRESLDRFRPVMVELEAEALTDRQLAQRAKINTRENFELVAREWVNHAVLSKAMENDGWEPEFMKAYFDTEVKEQVNAYLTERVWQHWGVEQPDLSVERPVENPYREILGDSRSALLEAQADHLQRLHAGRDADDWRSERERAQHALATLDRDAARETWRIERSERRAIEAAHEALARSEEFEQRQDLGAAKVQHELAAASRRELAGHLDREWQQYQDGRHLSDWMAASHHQAATVLAADAALALEAQRAQEAELVAHPVVDNRQQVPDVGVGRA